MGREFRIICRVRLSDIVSVRQSANKKTASQAISRASSRQLDFILVDKQDMSPILAIDLVHNQGKEGYKTQRDWFVSGALDAAGVPHARIKVKSGYTVDDIRECLENKLIPYRRIQQKKCRSFLRTTLSQLSARLAQLGRAARQLHKKAGFPLAFVALHYCCNSR